MSTEINLVDSVDVIMFFFLVCLKKSQTINVM